MYGRAPLGTQRFCKECTERSNRPISNENALFEFWTVPLEKKCRCIGGIKKKNRSFFFLGGGGGGGRS